MAIYDNMLPSSVFRCTYGAESTAEDRSVLIDWLSPVVEGLSLEVAQQVFGDEVAHVARKGRGRRGRRGRGRGRGRGRREENRARLLLFRPRPALVPPAVEKVQGREHSLYGVAEHGRDQHLRRRVMLEAVKEPRPATAPIERQSAVTVRRGGTLFIVPVERRHLVWAGVPQDGRNRRASDFVEFEERRQRRCWAFFEGGREGGDFERYDEKEEEPSG